MVFQTAGAAQWDAILPFDAGDTFVAAPFIPRKERKRIQATAEFLVDQLSDEGLLALTIGDQDIALGRTFLEGLAERAKFPFLGANIVDRKSGKPIFEAHTYVEVAGHKIGVVGLISESNGQRATAVDREKYNWTVSDPVEAAQAAVAELKKAGADLFVLLGHLTPEDEETVVTAVPDFHLVLGGQNVTERPYTSRVGEALSVSASKEGKHVSVTTLHLWEGTPLGRLEDRGRAAALDNRIAEFEAEVANFEARIKDLTPTDGSEAPVAVARLEQEAAGARADLRLVKMDREDAEEIDLEAHFVSSELVPLSADIDSDPEVALAVERFRETYPDPKKKKKKREDGE